MGDIAQILTLRATCSFPPPRIFSNALLANPDITSLIRDTEVHERALFSVPPPPPPVSQTPDPAPSTRRQTVFNVAGGEVSTGPPPSSSRGGPRRNTAVAAVLGAPLHAQLLQRGGTIDGQIPTMKGDVDVEVLLRGAEKLCTVYPLPGAAERISQQRQKFGHQNNTLAYYETRVNEQSQALERRTRDHQRDEDEEYEGKQDVTEERKEDFTIEELRQEEEEVRELEKKKKELQERLRATEKDLGGLLNL
jgi:hypothetical protein